MTPLHALVLGVIQGLTEFLPISSSGHLLLVPYLFGWPEQPLAFDVALHIGTTLAVVLYFHRDWSVLLSATARDVRRCGLHIRQWDRHARLTVLIGVGTLPAVVAGLLLADVEERIRAPGVVVVMLVIGSVYMAAADWWASRHPTDRSGVDAMTPLRALVIGVAQSTALIPGMSRSGATIATGMFTGLGREAAARFSFLLATPITVAAAVKEVPNLRYAAEQGVTGADVGIGIGVSFAVGMAAIAFLLRYLAVRPLALFVWYRLALASVVVVFLLR